MYKKRLARWGARKSYTLEQKKAAISQLSHEQLATDHTSLMQVNGQPSKLGRLWRPVQHHGTQIPLAQRPGRGKRRVIGARSTLPQNPLISEDASFVLCPTIADSAADTNTGTILQYADMFYTSHRKKAQAPAAYHYTEELRAVFGQLEAAKMFLHTDIDTAFAILNRVCAGGVELFRSQPFPLLHCLVAGLGNDWTAFEHIRLALLGFFASVSKQTLGGTHPVTRVASRLHASEKAERAYMQSSFAALLTYTWAIVKYHNDGIPVDVDVIIVHFLFGAGRDAQALTMCEELRENAQVDRGSGTRSSRSMLSVLAMYYQRQGQYVEAERMYIQLLRWTSEPTGRLNGDKEGVYACGGLGLLCHATGRYAEAEHHYQLAIEGGLSCPGVSNADSLMTLASWEDLLEKQGKVEERRQPRQKYRNVWAELDQWRLPRVR